MANLSFDTSAWLRDEELSACSSATRGIWMDLLCRMHEDGRVGEISGTAEELAKKARCTSDEFIEAARDLKENQAAQVRFDGSMFFLRNRRMTRAADKRKADAERQMRHRQKERDTVVTPIDTAFERFWTVFPKARKQAKGPAREAFRKAAAKADPEAIIQAAAEYAASERAASKYVQGPEPWLNQERWNDDRAAWRDLDKPEDAFRDVTKEEFLEAVTQKRFKEGPKRATGNQLWVFGTLRDGTKIQCKDYWPPKSQ